ncbi:hypothetical protein [Nitratireductor sp. XY-223]|uniref:hypothetical protein n=1 Tax=Nitratireductor sp. XY-223 TaxID=2561926 RepID=UPI0010AA473D|nr:hypothetical protein [Nitratireductor sp. XY-223]
MLNPRRHVLRLRSVLGSLICALLVAMMATTQPARAECPLESQTPVYDIGFEFLRDLLISTKSELEQFFDININEFCLDEEEYGAYYDMEFGNLVLGDSFLLEKANPPGNVNNVIAIIAHETAHAFQHKHGLLNMLVEQNPHRVKCIELHADFLTGGYMRWRAQDFDINHIKLTTMFYRLGDRVIESDSHHGLGPERYVTFLQGFNTVAGDVITLSSMGIAYVSQADCDE